MFRKPQPLKTFISCVRLKISQPQINSFYKNLLHFSFQVQTLNPIYSFSSSQDLQQDQYQNELSLLKNFSHQQKNSLSQIFEKYAKDLNLLNSSEREQLLKGLSELSLAHKEAGNLDKSYNYLSKINTISKELGQKENISIALNYYEMASILITQDNWIEAEYCTQEVSRICKQLGDDPAAKDLVVKNYYIKRKLRRDKKIKIKPSSSISQFRKD